MVQLVGALQAGRVNSASKNAETDLRPGFSVINGLLLSDVKRSLRLMGNILQDSRGPLGGTVTFRTSAGQHAAPGLADVR